MLSFTVAYSTLLETRGEVSWSALFISHAIQIPTKYKMKTFKDNQGHVNDVTCFTPGIVSSPLLTVQN